MKGESETVHCLLISFQRRQVFLKLYSVKIYLILSILEIQKDLTPIHLVASMHCQNTNCKSVKSGKEY